MARDCAWRGCLNEHASPWPASLGQSGQIGFSDDKQPSTRRNGEMAGADDASADAGFHQMNDTQVEASKKATLQDLFPGRFAQSHDFSHRFSAL
jgi:hypothetical protein